MPRFAANLSMMFNEVPFLDRFEAAAKAGFSGVEFLFPCEHPAAEIAARLEGAGLRQVLFNLPPGDWTKGERGLAALPGREAEFESAVRTALAYAEALGCPRVHAMSGLVHHGARRATYVANLKMAARMARDCGVEIIIEPINARDIPGYFLNRTSEARAVIHEVGEPNLGLQFDIYHRQVTEGDIATAIREYASLTRHYQIAGPPDRGEPDEGELDYPWLFELIDGTGFQGWIGCEYKPRRGTLEGLQWVERCGVRLG
ncbi:MAG: hydroxypyruvate isomerase family protein [Hyphomicrobiaceae bacterium]|nr:hydroxypyruvate isomerase family protein [Hyphomicrobiaceae bacterium]